MRIIGVSGFSDWQEQVYLVCLHVSLVFVHGSISTDPELFRMVNKAPTERTEPTDILGYSGKEAFVMGDDNYATTKVLQRRHEGVNALN